MRLNRESATLTQQLFKFQHSPQIKDLKNRKEELLSPPEKKPKTHKVFPLQRLCSAKSTVQV